MKLETVHLYVFDSLSDWEIGYAAAGINNPQLQLHPGRYRLQTVALRKHTSNSPEYLAATGYGGLSLYENSPAVTDDNLVTASGVAPLEFAQHIFRKLGLYSPEVLDAWYGLFKTGEPKYFEALMQAMKQ